MKRAISLCLLAFFLLLNSSLALKLGPSGQQLEYAPGKEVIVSYFFIAEEGGGDYQVTLTGDLAEYSSLVDNQPTISAKHSEKKTFQVSIKIPPLGIEPGEKSLKISVEQKLSSQYGQPQIGAVVKVSSYLPVYVPYPHKYLIIKRLKTIKEQNEVGKPVYFELGVKSLSTQTIKRIFGGINIFNAQNQKIATVPLVEVKDLSELAESTLYAEWTPSEKEGPGSYLAKAQVNFDDINTTLTAERQFTVGLENIELLEVAPNQIFLNQIQEVKLKVKSVWNDELNYRGESTLYGAGGLEVYSYKSPTTTLAPWGEGWLPVYLDTKGLDAGVYQLQSTLFFNNKVNSRVFPLTLVPGLPAESAGAINLKDA